MKNHVQALAMHFGCDVADIKEIRYHETQTTGGIYTNGDYYYCCIKKGKKLPKSKDEDRIWDWVEVADSLLNQNDWHVYRYKFESL